MGILYATQRGADWGFPESAQWWTAGPVRWDAAGLWPTARRLWPAARVWDETTAAGHAAGDARHARWPIWAACSARGKWVWVWGQSIVRTRTAVWSATAQASRWLWLLIGAASLHSLIMIKIFSDKKKINLLLI